MVTGAARGIGAAIARRFAAEGARVLLADLEAALVDETARSIGDAAVAVAADVTDADAVRALFRTAGERFGALDVLVANAGRPFALTTRTATEADWDACLDLNLRSAWRCAREAYPLLARAGGGSIVTVASTQGYRSGRESFPYSAAKGGLLALTRSLAVEYAPARIRANAIIPGQVESVRTEAHFAAFRDPEEARRRVLATFPLGRLGTPEDVAGAALFLASDDAAWVTGSWLVVDGGRDAALVDLSDLR